VAKAERFVQIKVTLNDIRPSATTLEDLHFIILAAMGLVANVGDGRKAPWNQPIFRLY